MKLMIRVYCIIITIGLCSCHSGQLKEVLSQAESLMENDPDSAFVLLSSYSDPENLSKADFAAFQLMYTKVKDKSYMDLSGDTVTILQSLIYH